jgi:hypothetical protein
MIQKILKFSGECYGIPKNLKCLLKWNATIANLPLSGSGTSSLNFNQRIGFNFPAAFYNV